MASTRITLTQGVWTSIVTIGADGWVNHTQGTTRVVYVIAENEPPAFDPETPTRYETERKQGFEFDGLAASESIWAYAINGDAEVSVSIEKGASLNLDADYFNGLAGFIVQPYTEANVKNGLQFYLRAAWPLADPIGSGDSVYISFRTTTKKVIAKTRIVSSIGEEISIEIFKGPSILPGNEGQIKEVSNYNGVNPAASTVVVHKNVDLTGGLEGTPIDDEPEYYFGSASTGQRVANSIPEGRERVLPVDDLFLIKITNTGSGNARMQYFLDWFEGEPDIPRS